MRQGFIYGWLLCGNTNIARRTHATGMNSTAGDLFFMPIGIMYIFTPFDIGIVINIYQITYCITKIMIVLMINKHHYNFDQLISLGIAPTSITFGQYPHPWVSLSILTIVIYIKFIPTKQHVCLSTLLAMASCHTLNPYHIIFASYCSIKLDP